MALPILYGSRESGHAYKVKLALSLLDVAHEYRDVDLRVPLSERRGDFRLVSPFGEVPVFVHGTPDTPRDAVAWLRSRAVRDLERLDLQLADQAFILGAECSVVDVACCAYLFWPEQAELDLTRWPNVGRWLDRIRDLRGWQAPYDLLQ